MEALLFLAELLITRAWVCIKNVHSKNSLNKKKLSEKNRLNSGQSDSLSRNIMCQSLSRWIELCTAKLT